MKKIFVVLALFSSSAFALLPPLAQSIREIEAIVSDPKFYSCLGSPEIIESIERTESGYLILTQNYSMEVLIHFAATKKIGPAQFSLEFQDPKGR
jgi:hypothetical protein